MGLGKVQHGDKDWERSKNHEDTGPEMEQWLEKEWAQARYVWGWPG